LFSVEIEETELKDSFKLGFILLFIFDPFSTKKGFEFSIRDYENK